MARFPGATWRPLPSTSYYPGRRSAQLGLVLHVQEGNNSPWGWFSAASHQASSTFWVAKSGAVEQYMEAGSDASWAQSAGNFTYDSVETEGYVTEPLTDAQIASLAALCHWEHDTFGMPLVAIETPGASGFGWHGMGGAAWGGHYGCPGDIRKGQRAQILGVSATSNTTSTGGGIPTAPGDLTATPPEYDMPLSPDDLTNIRKAILEQPIDVNGAGLTTVPLAQLLADIATSARNASPESVWAKGINGGASAEAMLAAINVNVGYAVAEATKAAAAQAGGQVDTGPLLDAIHALPAETVAAIKAAL